MIAHDTLERSGHEVGPKRHDGAAADLPPPEYRIGLQFVRASGLAQTRLQLALLSGNRRRVLEEIDRLVYIDRQIERLLTGGSPPAADAFGEALQAELTDQKRAIASEKLVLTAGIEPTVLSLRDLPEEEAPPCDEVDLRRGLSHALVWATVLMVLGVAAAATTVLTAHWL